MKVRFWGVRGFYPTAAPEFLRYGGNTAAIEVRSDAGDRLLLDLGTGAIALGRSLMAEEFGKGQGHLSVLLSHTHLDHTAALPFFAPVFVPGNRIDIYGAAGDQSLHDVLEALFDPHVCPINSLQNLGATLQVRDIADGAFTVPGFTVQALRVPHGHAVGVGWRIVADGRALAVLTGIDHPHDAPLPDAVALARDAHLLLHDATWSPELPDWGHVWGGSTVAQAIAVAEAAGVGQLALTHHGPRSTDERLDQIHGRARGSARVPVTVAVEGTEVEV